jgi:hypothetical protein
VDGGRAKAPWPVDVCCKNVSYVEASPLTH